MSNALQVALATGGLFTGVVGLLVYVARLYFSGKLVPRTSLDDMKTQYEERLKREAEISTYYRVSSEVVTTTLARQVQLTERLVEDQKLIKDFILGLKNLHGDSSAALPEGKSTT